MAETAKRYNSILKIIDDRLIPDEGAKKARGEVFTPLNLVREMLFGIRKSATNKGETEIWGIDKEGNFFDDNKDDRIGGIPLSLWREPETKWLDPANGIGNFPVVAFYMLDYQLGEHGPKELKGDDNKIKRRRHIIKNMLYMIELNKGNVNTSRKIFEKIVPGVTPNIVCANTLEMTDEKLKREFGINRFDVVMGNPPFNNSLDKNPTGHAQDTGLWEIFVKISIERFLQPKTGILAFLHPARWRQPDHLLHSTMFSKQFIFLSIFNKKEGFKQFKAITRFDYYILINNTASHATPVKFEDNTLANIHINNSTPFIANFGHDIWEKILDTKIKSLDVLGGGSSIKYTKSDHAFDDKCPESKPFLNVNTTAKTPKIPRGAKYKKTRKNSNSSIIHVDMVCSSNEHPLRKNSKVIFSKNEVIYSFYDSGKYGLTSNAFSILVKNKEEGDTIVKYLNSKLIKYLIASVKFGNFSTAKNIFSYIPNPLLFKGTFSEKNIYSNLELEKKHIDRIDKDNLEEYVESDEENNSSQGGGSRKSHRFTRRKSRV